MATVFSTTDTIVAIATPPGRGGIGVVRVSGPDAVEVTGRLVSVTAPLRPRYATLTAIRVPQRPNESLGAAVTSRGPTSVDRAVVTFFPGPHSYTGEDVVEISAHGSPVVLNAIVDGAVSSGARLAEPGEFTFRAYLNGRIDLMQAEAVQELVDAVTPLHARVAFDQLQGTLTRAIGEIDAALFDLIARLEASVDFPDEGYHFADRTTSVEAVDGLLDRIGALLASGRQGRMIREGFHVVIVGPPNVGKSSLFNALVGSERAIVTEVPGTTRDLVSEAIDLRGFTVTFVDTAGVRSTNDIVEVEGVLRARQAAAVADLLLIVADGSQPSNQNDSDWNHRNTVLVANKSDLPAAWRLPNAVQVSTITGDGLDALRDRILQALDVEPLTDSPAITNQRHLVLLDEARQLLLRARMALSEVSPMPEEFVLADLQLARKVFDEITGRRTPDDVLAHIFAKFCIGK